MKILDVQLFEQVVTDTQSALKEKSDQIADLQQAIDAFVNMEDAFKGKAGNAMRGYFRDFHQPFLLYLQSFLSEYNEQLNKVLKDLSAFEPDPNGYIQEAFIQDGIVPALKKLENTVGYLLEDANAAMRKVSDLISLPKLDVEEKLYYIQKARKKAKKTIEHLHDFDSKAASTLDSFDKDMDTMERFVRQMESMAGNGSLDIATYNPKQFVTTNAYRSLEGELIQKSGVKPVKTMRAQDFGGHLSVKLHVYEDGVTAMEYRKPGSKQVYYELVDEIPKEAIPSEKKPDDPLYLDIWNGFYKGAGEVVGDIIGTVAEIPKMAYMIGYKGAEFADRLVFSPSPKAYLYSSVHKGIDMAKYMCQSVKNAFERDVVHGDAETRTEFFTHGIGTIGISLFGDKGLSKLSTPAKAVAEEPKKSSGNLRENIGVAPAFEAAGTGTTYKIPYNVLQHCKENILKIIEEQFSTVKYGEHYTKVNRKKTLKPNVQYMTSQGYKYTTDELGRIIDVEAKLELGNAKRNNYAQRTVGGDDRLVNDDGGHLIAIIFEGSGEIDNLVPMDAKLNRSEYKTLENTWKAALKEGKSVEVKIKPIYRGKSNRPSIFEITFKIDGKKREVTLKNFVEGEK